MYMKTFHVKLCNKREGRENSVCCDIFYQQNIKVKTGLDVLAFNYYFMQLIMNYVLT